jgi:hypothetical protein
MKGFERSRNPPASDETVEQKERDQKEPFKILTFFPGKVDIEYLRFPYLGQNPRTRCAVCPPKFELQIIKF